MITKNEIGIITESECCFLVSLKGKDIGPFIIEYTHIKYDISSGSDRINIKLSMRIRDIINIDMKSGDEVYVVVNGVKIGPFGVRSLSKYYKHNIFKLLIETTLENHHKTPHAYAPLVHGRE